MRHGIGYMVRVAPLGTDITTLSEHIHPPGHTHCPDIPIPMLVRFGGRFDMTLPINPPSLETCSREHIPTPTSTDI